MRLVMTLLAPLLGWISFQLFRMPLFKKSPRKHRLVMKLFRYAADNGSVRALSVYGHLLFYRGEGETNKVQGAIYLERAADKGDMKAAYQMGKIFEQGYQNFPMSQEKACRYYQAAAEQGHVLALRRMVDAYSEGELGLDVSESEAGFWQAKLTGITAQG
ncbi:tetratricopeptide repeat protein [Amphritea balenae]|uniref:Sel1 repeat family protein n=1 Tax=Amphritea balenae TaxID=452629 RepID=A0A3P1SS93_9GAMM|nr:SEL1-like repeat protein [Amphritea balenae]RRD00059.1 sel1 repeat family protein [Amphritea balenae]GGK76207.1 hypothetical protein GCM10007941_28020 [Amphritea balenae]